MRSIRFALVLVACVSVILLASYYSLQPDYQTLLDKQVRPKPLNFISKEIQLTTVLTTPDNFVNNVTPDPFACLKRNDNLHMNIINIADIAVRKDKTIFFLETSCKSRKAGHVVLTGRQACAVESAARINSRLDVLVLILSPVPIGSDPFVEAITENYGNVQIVHADIRKYMLDTPVESLYHGGRLQRSKWPMIHLSDVLRYVTLWKYGGIYMDLDVLIMKNLEDIGPNFTGLQDADTVAAGMIGFTSSGQGHEWVNKLLTELNEHYSPDLWSYNALGVLHNLLTDICDTEQVANMTTEQCHGYQVQPIDVFYPVPYYQWQKYFNGQYRDEVLQHVYGNLTRAIHVWNKLSASERPANNSAYPILAAKHCPKVFELAANNF